MLTNSELTPTGEAIKPTNSFQKIALMKNN